MMTKKHMSLSKHRMYAGLLFTVPFIIGFILFFFIPLIMSINFSFSKIEIIQAGFRTLNVGIENYKYAFTVDPQFIRTMTGTIVTMFTDVPAIVIFSFFSAILLNQKFRFRPIARSVFFLPVIIATGVIASVESSDYLLRQLIGAAAEGLNTDSAGVLSFFDMRGMLLRMKISPEIVGYVINTINHIYIIVISSGVQILIFLAGLQSLDASLYEASSIEGANGWENFCFITFPMMGPIILVNTIYSTVDSFTNSNNNIMVMIRDIATKQISYGYSSAIACIYFLVILVILGLIVSVSYKKIKFID